MLEPAMIVVLHGNAEGGDVRAEATARTTATHPVSPMTQTASISTAAGRNPPPPPVLEGASFLSFHVTRDACLQVSEPKFVTLRAASTLKAVDNVV